MRILIKLNIGKNAMTVNGAYKPMDVSPFIQNDRTFVPVRFVSEALGYNVEWDDSKKEVTIYGRKKYFDTMHDCAFDWAMHFNAASIALFKEFGGIIYKDENGYYWDEVKIGQEKEVFWNREKVKKGVAFIHSHSGGPVGFTNAMSMEDRAASDKFNRPLYMVDSGGTLWVTDKSDNPITTARSQEKIREGAPVDCRYVDMAESAENMRQYFNNNYHGLPEFAIGYLADFYNRMYMLNKKYTDIQECKNL